MKNGFKPIKRGTLVRKPYATKIVFALLLILFCFMLAFAGFQNLLIPSVHAQTGYTYMIYQDPNFATNRLYDAKNAEGTLTSSSTDLQTLWNNVVNNLPTTTDGMFIGSIIFNEGLFVTNAVLQIPQFSSITISGINEYSTEIKLNDSGINSWNIANAVFYYTSSHGCVANPTNAFTSPPFNQIERSIPSSLTIQDLSIDTTQEPYFNGIVAVNCSIVTISHCNLNGYWYNNNGSSLSQSFYSPLGIDESIIGVCLLTSNSGGDQGPNIMTGNTINGYGVGLIANQDHFTSVSDTIQDCYNAIQFDVWSYDQLYDKTDIYLSSGYAVNFTNNAVKGVTFNAPTIENAPGGFAFYEGGNLAGCNVAIINPQILYLWAGQDYLYDMVGIDISPSQLEVTVGSTVTAGQVLYITGNGQYFLAKASSTSTMNAVALATQSATSGAPCLIINQGTYTDSSWDWTVGGTLYVSASTAGGLTQTQPSGSGNIIENIGYALSATEIYFNPQSSDVTAATTTTTATTAGSTPTPAPSPTITATLTPLPSTSPTLNVPEFPSGTIVTILLITMITAIVMITTILFYKRQKTKVNNQIQKKLKTEFS